MLVQMFPSPKTALQTSDAGKQEEQTVRIRVAMSFVIEVPSLATCPPHTHPVCFRAANDLVPVLRPRTFGMLGLLQCRWAVSHPSPRAS